MIIDENEKKQILTEVLESPEFKDSKRYQDLLQYLFKETLKGTVPKESTIGSDFFQKDSKFDPKEDPTVRVYLNNLRKKLDHYYLSSDKFHPYRLEIPRGRYQVEFVKVDKPIEKPKIKKIPYLAILFSIIATIVASFLFSQIFYKDNQPHKGKTNIIWKEFLQPNGRPTLIVLGDFFFLSERKRELKKRNFVRNPDINASDDFKEMVKQHPSFASLYVQSDFTFLRPSASWGLANILSIIQSSPNNYSLKLASQFTVEDLKTHNIVFIGAFKTLYTLHKLLRIFHLEYSLSPNKFQIQSDPPDSVINFSPTDIKGGSYEKDFAVIAKGSGPEGSTVLFLLGFADTGVLEASRAVTDQQMVNTITNELATGATAKPFHFTLVVETEGLNQAIFKSHVLYFNQNKMPKAN
jgi:hypothetical protein